MINTKKRREEKRKREEKRREEKRREEKRREEKRRGRESWRKGFLSEFPLLVKESLNQSIFLFCVLFLPFSFHPFSIMERWKWTGRSRQWWPEIADEKGIRTETFSKKRENSSQTLDSYLSKIWGEKKKYVYASFCWIIYLSCGKKNSVSFWVAVVA